MNAADAAREYLRRGFQPVPIPAGTKAPCISNWQHLKVTESEIPALFRDNVGLLLGEPSHGLVDVDLDAVEAVRLAPHLLPPTGMIHGRPGNPRSHLWYLVDSPVATTQFKDAADGCIVELRSTGAQTVVPPSRHPTGDLLAWEENGEPARIAPDTLKQAVSRLAAAALLLRHYPQEGGRQDFAMAVAGLLAKGGIEPDFVVRLVGLLADEAGDEESDMRQEAARRTIEKLRAGNPVTGLRALSEIIGEGPAKKVCQWLRLAAGRSPTDTSAGSGAPDRSQKRLQDLVSLVQQARLFHTPEEEAFITVDEPHGPDTFPIDSQRFERWIAHKARERGHPIASKSLMDDLRRHVSAETIVGSPVQPVFRRVAGDSKRMMLDIGDPERRIIEVTGDGWRLAEECPVAFVRSSGSQAIPMPKPLPPNDISYFEQFFNTSSLDELRLLIAWMLFSWNPSGPYPILILQGEAGSAKTTMARLIKLLLDPASPPTRALPGTEQDCIIAARANHILAFDDLSGINNRTSDLLCRLSTGAGFATRRLYKNCEEVRFDIRRPLILNGIDDIATRQDLVDRASVINLPRIPADRRIDETTLQRNFESARPYLIGSLLAMYATALQRVSSVALSRTPRMADFARWSTAAEPSICWEPGGFLRAYESNQADALEIAIESSPVGIELRRLVLGNGFWKGTATDLLKCLNDKVDESISRGRTWPKLASVLGNELRRIAPALLSQGIEFTTARASERVRTRVITLKLLMPPNADKPTAQTAPVQPVRSVQVQGTPAPPVEPRLTPLRKPDRADGPDGSASSGTSRPKRRHAWMRALFRK